MTVQLSEHPFEFLSLKGGFIDLMSLHVPKCHIVGNHVTAQFRAKFRPLALHYISCAGPNDQADYMAYVCNNE